MFFLSGDEEQRPQATCGFWMVSFFVLQAWSQVQVKTYFDTSYVFQFGPAAVTAESKKQQAGSCCQYSVYV